MRKLMLGMLLAAGAALPTMAMAGMTRQDRPQEDRPQGSGEHRQPGGERPQNGSGRQDQPRPAPQAAAPAAAPQRPQAAPAAPQAQVQAQAQARGQAQAEARGDGGRFRGDAGVRVNGGGPNRGGGDPNRGAPPTGYRGQPGAVRGGPGGYVPQDQGRGPGPQYRPAPGNQGQFRPNGGGNWSRGWRDDRRYDWGRYRAQNRGAFHLPRYYAPPGWQYGYRRFSPGFTLWPELFDRGFWIDDAYAYRLPPAYWPYQWVRYYNDALLVDVRTGYVVDTVYDIFW